ncbi:MAG: hypothetical protein LBG79_04570 [Spirochaetaceae bacterium]|jgi:hypothetical protein|nr:hypothetical protein [Spirochaetaceae bacterium]
MAKKIVLVLALASMIAGGLAAQEKTAAVKKVWLSGEVSLVGAGARGEFMLGPKMSLGLNTYWTSAFFIFNDIDINAVARFYPWGKKFYAGLGVGFGIHSGLSPVKGKWDVDGTKVEYPDDGSSYLVTLTGVDITPELGWKIDIGKAGGFFINPLVQVPITIGQEKAAVLFGPEPTRFGVGVGFRAACGFGWAF